jgi:ethanolamine utilization protein EutQ (cupin superfamily)
VNHRIDFAELDWVTAGPGARSKAFDRDGSRLRLLELTPEFIEADWCRKGHIGVVLEGRLEIDFSGRVEQYEPGHALFIPPGEPGRHKAHALSERVLLFVVEPV